MIVLNDSQEKALRDWYRYETATFTGSRVAPGETRALMQAITPLLRPRIPWTFRKLSRGWELVGRNGDSIYVIDHQDFDNAWPAQHICNLLNAYENAYEETLP